MIRTQTIKQSQTVALVKINPKQAFVRSDSETWNKIKPRLGTVFLLLKNEFLGDYCTLIQERKHDFL